MTTIDLTADTYSHLGARGLTGWPRLEAELTHRAKLGDGQVKVLLPTSDELDVVPRALHLIERGDCATAPFVCEWGVDLMSVDGNVAVYVIRKLDDVEAA